jgi:Uncharacterised protein family (UPF0236)
VSCDQCHYAAKFHSYQPRRVVTAHGVVKIRRAYYYCQRCHQSFLPYDDAVGLRDEVSPGLKPLVCMAGTLAPFADAAEDILKRFANVRLSTSTVLRTTEGEGERLRAQLKEGRMVEPSRPETKWTKTPEKDGPDAYVGLDAFSVPMQGIQGAKAEHRMLYTALLYTPKKEHTRYLIDFDLEALAEQVRLQARALGLADVSQLIAITDGGNGLEEALQRHLADNITTILDWYHAAEHVSDFAKAWHDSDERLCACWRDEATGILYERGGEALLDHLRTLTVPAAAQEELRKLMGYFENNRHRTDYPSYRAKGWDIGSGPTEAGCKIIGERLKGSGMRWVEDGAATVATLRALYVSGGHVWDGFWSQPHRLAA